MPYRGPEISPHSSKIGAWASRQRKRMKVQGLPQTTIQELAPRRSFLRKACWRIGGTLAVAVTAGALVPLGSRAPISTPPVEPVQTGLLPLGSTQGYRQGFGVCSFNGDGYPLVQREPALDRRTGLTTYPIAAKVLLGLTPNTQAWTEGPPWRPITITLN